MCHLIDDERGLARLIRTSPAGRIILPDFMEIENTGY